MISVRMLKLCGESVLILLQLIFKSCLESGTFPSEWKKPNVVPVHKKGDKQTLKNYRLIKLLPICRKIFEILMYNKMFEYLIENDLISHSQSGFKPRYSYINQLLSITHEIDRSTKLEVYVLTYRKPSIRFGTKDSFINLEKTVYQVIY